MNAFLSMATAWLVLAAATAQALVPPTPCAFSAGSLDCQLGNLAPGKSITLTFEVSVNQPFPEFPLAGDPPRITTQGLVLSSAGAHNTDDPDTAPQQDATRTGIATGLNVDGQTDVRFSRMVFNRRTGNTSTTVAVGNTSATPLDPSLMLVIDNLNPPAANVTHADGSPLGLGLDGKPLLVMTNSILDPGEQARQTLVFSVPGRSRLSFDTQVLQGGAPPAPKLLAPPDDHALLQNTPNPFNPSTQIKYQLPEAGQVTLAVYNVLGQPIRTLVQEFQDAGFYQVTWDGTNDRGETVSNGLYIYQLVSNDWHESRRMMLVK